MNAVRLEADAPSTGSHQAKAMTLRHYSLRQRERLEFYPLQ